MKSDRELMQMALNSLYLVSESERWRTQREAIQALRDRLSQEAALDKMVAENERLGLYEKFKGCPPCNHNCNEGRDCPARKF